MTINIKGPVLVRFHSAETDYGSTRNLDVYVDVTRILTLTERVPGVVLTLDGGVKVYLSDSCDKVLARLSEVAEEMK